MSDLLDLLPVRGKWIWGQHGGMDEGGKSYVQSLGFVVTQSPIK